MIIKPGQLWQPVNIEVNVFTHLYTPPLPFFFFPLPIFLAPCSCTTLFLPACPSPFLYLRSVTGEFPELITGGSPRVQQGPNHLHAEGVRGDCLITFSTAWLKTAHKSLVHMGLATGACMGTCTVVNTAIKHNYITSRHYTASFGCQFSHYPTKKLQILIFMKCLQFIELIRNCTKEGVCHTNILMTFKYQYGHDAQMFDREVSSHKMFPWIVGMKMATLYKWKLRPATDYKTPHDSFRQTYLIQNKGNKQIYLNNLWTTKGKMLNRIVH